MDIKEAAAKIKEKSGNKKVKYLAVVILIAVIISIYFSSLETTGSPPDVDIEKQVETDLETRLENTLSMVENAGSVKVVINYESTGEVIPALNSQKENSNNSGGTSSTREITSPATLDDEAIVLKEVEPDVRGVVVVAQGADNISVKMSILDAVTTLLNVPSSKVEILKMSE